MPDTEDKADSGCRAWARAVRRQADAAHAWVPWVTYARQMNTSARGRSRGGAGGGRGVAGPDDVDERVLSPIHRVAQGSSPSREYLPQS